MFNAIFPSLFGCTPQQGKQEWTYCSSQNKSCVKHCIVIVSISCLIGIKPADVDEKYSLLSTATTGQNIVHLLWSECQHLWYWGANHTSFVVGKSYDVQLKYNSTYASSCKMLVWFLVKEPFLFIYYIAREIFYCLFFSKSIFHFYS